MARVLHQRLFAELSGGRTIVCFALSKRALGIWRRRYTPQLARQLLLTSEDDLVAAVAVLGGFVFGWSVRRRGRHAAFIVMTDGGKALVRKVRVCISGGRDN